MALNARKTATDIVYNTIKKSSSLSAELDVCRKNCDFGQADMRLISELCSGTLRNLEFLDEAVKNASNIKINKISPYVLAVLRVGAYQLLFTDKIPSSAAVDETVKIVKKSANYRLAGYVNAVMRKISENGTNFALPKGESEKLSVKYSFPLWIVKKWQQKFGDETELLLSALREKPNTVLRANTLKTTAPELLKMLTKQGCEGDFAENIFNCENSLLSISKMKEIENLKAYKNGMFYIQDSSAAFASLALSPKAGSLVLDMCAAPGGKCTHMAEIMGNSGKIIAFDIYDRKVEKINENAKRLGIDIINATRGDASLFMPEFENTADYVLCDVPCSGLGTVRRKPDIKYSRKESDIAELSKIASTILDNGAKYLKCGGKMLFSTCTLTNEENEGQLFKFLERNKNFKLKKIDCAIENDGYITLTPYKNKCDGFFISLLEKVF